MTEKLKQVKRKYHFIHVQAIHINLKKKYKLILSTSLPKTRDWY